MPGSSTAGEVFTSAAAPTPAAPAADDDDEIDLFGSDDDEDAEAERVKAERVAAYNAKKANKPKTVAKVRPAFLLYPSVLLPRPLRNANTFILSALLMSSVL